MLRAPSRSALPALLTTATAVTALVAATLVGAAPASAAEATDGPGALSHFDQSRKDCVGTSRTTTSKIWFTVADGVLSDVYAPTVDTTNVETMQYLVTDGSTFTDLQQRDTTYTVSSDATGMSCTVVATAKSGAYRITTTYFTDPDRASVVSRVRYQALKPKAAAYKLYVRLDATAGGNGGGGTGNGGKDSALVDASGVPVTYDTVTATNAANRDYAQPTYVALAGDRTFGAVSSGFVGTASDGLTQLDTAHQLTPVTDTANGGNVEQTAAVTLDDQGDSTLTVAVAATQARAVATARTSARADTAAMLQRYVQGWTDYDQVTLNPPSYHLPGLNLTDSLAAARRYFIAANVVKASEDKTFPGAIVAGLGSPWGQAVSAGDPANTYFGSYREVFARDLYQTWSALYTAGDLATARDTVRFLFLRQQQADGSFPRNSLLNGKTAPDSFNVQPDEVAFPILMAQQSGLGGDKTLWPHVRAAADYLVAHGPAFGVERWEEQSGYSPSTIAAEIAGLVAAGTIAAQQGDAASSRVFLATADTYQRSVQGWAVTTNGPLSKKPYFIRLSKTGDPNAAISYNVGNGGPTLDQREVVDAGFLDLVRLGAMSPSDPVLANSLEVVDATIKRSTRTGPGWLRYNGDGYGDCIPRPDPNPQAECSVLGAPWAPSDKGTGGIWPVLASERGEYSLLTGDAAAGGVLAKAIVAQSAGVGLVPEQAWTGPAVPRAPYGSDPTTASIGFVNGKPNGSTAPLTWGVSSLVRLVADLTAGEALEKPTVTTARYVDRQQASTTLTVTSPADQSPGTGTIRVTGTAVPGAKVDVARVATDRNGVTTIATTKVGAQGRFSVPVTLAPGSNALVVTSTAPDGGTASQLRTVFADVVDGTLVYQTSDPTGDDNGPGTYQYPTAGDFHAGAYDLTNFQVYDSGDTVTFRVQTRDLTPTFGSALGAQLVDLYVTQPGVTPTSSAASFAQRNHTVDPAWTQLIEAQGFGQRFVDAAGTTLGSLTITGNQISRYITIVAPKSAFGGATPGSGWSFSVTLTGQDGFSPDNARGFQSTPGAYQFGVCAAGDTSPICAVDPSTVPKVMDTIPPAGVSQAAELDPTAGPVVVHGFTLP
ncbi:glucodextranase DOMON-like domain-containing protein [Jatrophihabitans sp. YIM 134969]